MLPTIQGEFNIVAEPEIRFNDSGKAWAKLRCKAADRVRQDDGTWKDGDACFIDVIVGSGPGAERLIENAGKGDLVVVTGKLKQREFEYNGEKRVSYSIVADSIGVSVRFPRRSQPTAVQAVQETLGGTVVQDDSPPF